MNLSGVVLCLALASAEALAQSSPEALRIQEQAAAVLAQARRCAPLIDKATTDRFAARATAVIGRAGGQPVARGASGDYENISSALTMAANCKNVTCPGKPPPLVPPNCPEFAKVFQALRINQPNWQINEGLR
jgi:hypothetical protein